MMFLNLLLLLPACGSAAAEQRLDEMWNWYQPNSEKLMSIMATFDKVCKNIQRVSLSDILEMCHISAEESRSLLAKVADLEYRLAAIEKETYSGKNSQAIDATAAPVQNEYTYDATTTMMIDKAPEPVKVDESETWKNPKEFYSYIPDTYQGNLLTLDEDTEGEYKVARLLCPPDYHQVGKSCYAISFFQALRFQDAAEQCRLQSDGHLAVFEGEHELKDLRHFLVQHIVANIHPYEAVSLWIGAITVASQSMGTSPMEMNWITNYDNVPVPIQDAQLCDPGTSFEHLEEANSIKCVSLTWNAPRNCTFDLELTHCGRTLRYICEALPIEY